MPNRLHRYYGAGHLHFITTSCYQRRPLLGTAQNRDLFLQVLESVRRRYGFVVVGYVVMPEHVHLLLSEPGRGNPSVVMRALKQGFARRFLARLQIPRATVRQTAVRAAQRPTDIHMLPHSKGTVALTTSLIRRRKTKPPRQPK